MLGLLQDLRPISGLQLATNLPTSGLAGRKTGQPKMVPTFLRESIDQVGNPALSRQDRHGYAADFHRDLLADTINRLRS
jgi:hypothetical protein